MLSIERIRMRLPSGFQNRASQIARMVGEALAEIQIPENRTLNTLRIGPVQVSPNATDWEIARMVAEQIASTIGEGT